MEFNMNEVLQREMKKYTTKVVEEAVKALSVEYGFKASEALSKMNLEEMRLRVAEKTEKTEKNKKAKEETPSIPLPFTGDIKVEWCHAIKQNHGLYSQCNNTPVTEGDVVLCKACNNQKEKKGKPTCGYIQERMEGPLMEYKDDKGKKVVTYGVVLKKLNIDRADAEAEATKYGIVIPEEQYEIPEKTKGRPKKEQDSADEAEKKRGRPKKEKKVVSGSAADDIVAQLINAANSKEKKTVSANAADTLLASLVAEAQAVKSAVSVEESATDESAPEPESEDEDAKKAQEEEKVAKQAQQDAEKALLKAQQEEEKVAKKAQQEQEKKEKKAQQDAEKAVLKAQQEQEKKEKKAQQDAEKAVLKAQQDADKAVLKAQQEQEKKEKAEQAKIAKKAQQEQEKADKKAQQEKEKAEKKAAPAKKTPEKAATPEPTPELEHEAEEEAAEATISVKKFEFEGRVYLRSSDNVLYNSETQEPEGMWNEDDNCIDEIEVEED